MRYNGLTLTDSYRAQGLRKKLVQEVASKGIYDSKVLEAIGKIPRHYFLDSSFLEFAYQDKPFPIGEGQTISQPYTVAYQSQLLEVEVGHKILEVGTGSGYQAIVLLEMGAKVYSVERVKFLYEKTKKILSIMGYKAKLFYGDGYKGLPMYKPFDRIIVTAAAPSIPDTLLNQLAPGGIMVIPVGDSNGIQIMKSIHKDENGIFTEKDHGQFRFVPMLENKK